MSDQGVTHKPILEIGEIGLFDAGLQEETESYFAGYRADRRRGRPYFGLRALLRAIRHARSGRYTLIVLHGPYYPWWHPRSFLAAFKFSIFKGRFLDLYGALASPFYFQLLRFVPMRSVVAIDYHVSFGIPAHHFFLLDKARAYFKRELPVDYWHALYGSGHRRLPGPRIRLKRKWRRRMAKVRPIGLALWDDQADEALAAYGAGKKTDVFFAGIAHGNSWVREDVPSLLDRLRAAGVKVDAPQERIARPEFIKRTAEAWITLSPAGMGWYCFRHVEAALAGSVPLVSAPTVQRYKPLIAGEQCLVYYPDEDRLIETIVDALGDKERLARMAASAHAHAKRYFTVRAICTDILDEWGSRSMDSQRNA